MRDYGNSVEGSRFAKGDKVRCIYNYGKGTRLHSLPQLGKVYEVLDCHQLRATEYIHIKADGYTGAPGGWYANHFELAYPPIKMRPKVAPSRFTNHRRIILDDTE